MSGLELNVFALALNAVSAVLWVTVLAIGGPVWGVPFLVANLVCIVANAVVLLRA